MKKLLARALNKNQTLLLEKISTNKDKTITGLIELVFTETKTPISTLKLNANILKNLELIEFFNGDPVRLTDFGKCVFSIVSPQNGLKESIAGFNPIDSGSNPGSGTKKFGGGKNG